MRQKCHPKQFLLWLKERKKIGKSDLISLYSLETPGYSCGGGLNWSSDFITVAGPVVVPAKNSCILLCSNIDSLGAIIF